MSIRILGALVVISGCGWFGFAMAGSHRARERLFRQMIRAAEYMACELEYRQTPLPQLCSNTSRVLDGELSDIFLHLAERLEERCYADVEACMDAVLEEKELSPAAKVLMMDLGRTLGQFDLNGQLRSLSTFRAGCEDALKELSRNRDNRLRSYQTLGLCTGAALAVLLL